MATKYPNLYDAAPDQIITLDLKVANRTPTNFLVWWINPETGKKEKVRFRREYVAWESGPAINVVRLTMPRWLARKKLGLSDGLLNDMMASAESQMEKVA